MKRFVAAVSVVVALAGCSTPLTTREKGALAGGAIGAGAGAVVGNQVGHTGTGALIGAGVGVVSGVLIGDAIQNAEQKSQAQTVVATPPPVSPPPQQVVVVAPPTIPTAPRLLWVPGWGLHVLEGHDAVYYNNSYYYFHNRSWWLAPSHTGPWVIVASAPPAIAKLPPGRLHAHVPGGSRGFCPPGQAKKGRC